MPKFTVSRRKVMTVLAGSLTACATPAIANNVSTVRNAEPGLSGAVQTKQQLRTLLQAVRGARGASSRAAAFNRFALSLRAYHASEADALFAPRTERSTSANDGRPTLYRQREPATVLAAVIVRELEGMPQSATWMTRFADLEAVIQA